MKLPQRAEGAFKYVPPLLWRGFVLLVGGSICILAIDNAFVSEPSRPFIGFVMALLGIPLLWFGFVGWRGIPSSIRGDGPSDNN